MFDDFDDPVRVSTTLMDHIARNITVFRIVILAIVSCTDRLIVCVMRVVVSASVNQISLVDCEMLARMVSTDIPIAHTVTVPPMQL